VHAGGGADLAPSAPAAGTDLRARTRRHGEQRRMSGGKEIEPVTGRRVEPWAARAHVIPRAIKPAQTALVRVFRRYFETAPGWVLLTTTGRRTGLPREVLLPCERWPDGLLIISTYGYQSDWMRNLRRDPRVLVTCAGWVVPA